MRGTKSSSTVQVGRAWNCLLSPHVLAVFQQPPAKNSVLIGLILKVMGQHRILQISCSLETLDPIIVLSHGKRPPSIIVSRIAAFL